MSGAARYRLLLCGLGGLTVVLFLLSLGVGPAAVRQLMPAARRRAEVVFPTPRGPEKR